jgi:hypothetical protein
MKRFSILILVAVLALACFAPTFVSAQPYVHGWLTKTTDGLSPAMVKPYGTATVWLSSPFSLPKSTSGKGWFALTATDMDGSAGDSLIKPQVICKLLGPDGATLYTDSSGAYFTITNVDTVNIVAATTMNYAIKYDFSAYGSVEGFLIGFKGQVVRDSTGMTVNGIRY